MSRSRQGLDDDHDPDRARPCTGCPATNQSTSRSNSRIEGSAFGSGSPQSWFHVAPDAAPASALVLVAPGVAPILGLPAPDALESWSREAKNGGYSWRYKDQEKPPFLASLLPTPLSPGRACPQETLPPKHGWRDLQQRP